MKVALLFLPAWSIKTAPLGVACISAALKSDGHTVHSFDWNVRLFHQLNSPHLWDLDNDQQWTQESIFKANLLPNIKFFLDQWVDELLKNNYDAIGFSAFRSNAYPTAYVSSLIKKIAPSVKLFIGGPAIVTPESALSYFFDDGGMDAAVVGEGEKTAIELLRRWQNNESIIDLNGIILKRGYKTIGRMVMNPRQATMNINDLPFPDFSDFNLSQYSELALGIQFSRGCVANCTFCTENTFYWPKFVSKSPEKIVEEINYQINKHEVQIFLPADSLMNGNISVLGKLSDLLIENQTNIQWGGNMRIDPKMTPDFLKKIKTANCNWIVFGIESGSDPILKAMRKGITHNQIITVIKNTYEAGIQVSINIIVGFPGETEEFFQDTLKLLETCSDYISFISSTVFGLDPNTYVGQNPEKYGIETLDSQEKTIWQEGPEDGLGWRSISGDSNREIRSQRLIQIRAFIETYLLTTKLNKVVDSL